MKLGKPARRTKIVSKLKKRFIKKTPNSVKMGIKLVPKVLTLPCRMVTGITLG